VQNLSISRQQVFVVGYPTAYRGTSRAKLADSIKRIFLKKISKKMFFVKFCSFFQKMIVYNPFIYLFYALCAFFTSPSFLLKYIFICLFFSFFAIVLKCIG